MGLEALNQVHQQTLSDKVAHSLKEAILNGELRPGSHLKTQSIAEQMGVSLAPVREAIAQLVERGLVESRPYRGAFVAELTPQDAKDLYVLRSAIEGLGGRLAAERTRPEDLEPLRRALREMEEALAANDYVRYASLGIHFHGKIVSLAGNCMLEELWSKLASQTRLSLTVTWPKYSHLHQANEHQLCLDAIASGDGDYAEQVMREHLVNFSQKVLFGAEGGETLGEEVMAGSET